MNSLGTKITIRISTQAFNPLENCLISGGPDTVSSEVCQNQKCRVIKNISYLLVIILSEAEKTHWNHLQDFTELTCNYKGNILKTYSKIVSPNECYQLCEKSRRCNYFLHSDHTMTCQLLDSKERLVDS